MRPLRLAAIQEMYDDCQVAVDKFASCSFNAVRHARDVEFIRAAMSAAEAPVEGNPSAQNAGAPIAVSHNPVGNDPAHPRFANIAAGSQLETTHNRG
jgi:hypothetical protein